VAIEAITFEIDLSSGRHWGILWQPELATDVGNLLAVKILS
jgi:hypothetical protein